MKFYKQDDIEVRRDDLVFKASPVGKFVYFVVFAALGIAPLVLALRGGPIQGRWHFSPFILYGMAVLFGLCGWYAFTVFRASLKPTNWLLRCTSSGVIIHYRSYLNWRFPGSDLQAVGFDYSEIAWARTVKELRLTPDFSQSRNTQRTSLTYLDFCVAVTDASALETQLQAERNLSPENMVTTRDYPVSVSPGGVIEVRWNGGTSPRVSKAIAYLRQHVTIATADSRKIDLTHHRNLRPEEERGKIIALLKSGDEMGAVQLTRQIYGYSLNEAKDFVDKLQAEG